MSNEAVLTPLIYFVGFVFASVLLVLGLQIALWVADRIGLPRALGVFGAKVVEAFRARRFPH